MPTYTHQYRPYRAEVIVWDGENTEMILKELGSGASIFRNIHGEYIMYRHPGGVSCLAIGNLIARGENGVIKFFTPDAFRLKYMPISENGARSPFTFVIAEAMTVD